MQQLLSITLACFPQFFPSPLFQQGEYRLRIPSPPKCAYVILEYFLSFDVVQSKKTEMLMINLQKILLGQQLQSHLEYVVNTFHKCVINVMEQ